MVVEDHQCSSQGIVDTLQSSEEFTFVIEATCSADEAYTMVVDRSFDIILLDIFLEREPNQNLVDGDDLLQQFNKEEDRPRVIVFSKVKSIETLDYVIHHLGAEGYILKGRNGLEEVLPAVDCVLHEGSYYSEAVMDILSQYSDLIEIDRVDRMILRMLVQGHLQKEIPGRLTEHGIELSGRGMEKRINKLKLKFGAITLPQLIYKAIKEGIIRMEFS